MSKHLFTIMIPVSSPYVNIPELVYDGMQAVAEKCMTPPHLMFIDKL
ncbi:hypothetical protein KDA_37570 [Dictyobacter alpinus]|uniref:Uncharacterized protein n=1 Tax=Dictyobacter alpinus TaxID=2014873 RepID=A0A402BA44_9CHLR|nr:hypothetical protein [Dictyobacter alpinus]GCE28273.1 hypothetical protein KDA_37570 [Dictyobacter alpinus]